jgi:hypothetical protein
VINSLSEKILRPAEEKRMQAGTIETERAQTVDSGKGGQAKGRAETEADVYYPYKADLKLRSLDRIKQNIERKERALRVA